MLLTNVGNDRRVGGGNTLAQLCKRRLWRENFVDQRQLSHARLSLHLHTQEVLFSMCAVENKQLVRVHSTLSLVATLVRFETQHRIASHRCNCLNRPNTKTIIEQQQRPNKSQPTHSSDINEVSDDFGAKFDVGVTQNRRLNPLRNTIEM
jgi:hypothetical protein